MQTESGMCTTVNDNIKIPSKKEVTFYRGAFKLIDQARKGFISSGDLVSLLEGLGKADYSAEQLESIINLLINANGDGKLLLWHFVCFMECSPVEADVLAETFRAFDSDGDGFIGPEELKEVLQKLGIAASDAHIRLMIEEADANGDGLVDFEEFCQIIKPQ